MLFKLVQSCFVRFVCVQLSQYFDLPFLAQSVLEWCGTPPLIRPIGTASSVKYGILLDDIKIMVSLIVLLSCIVVDSIRSCFMTLIMQSKDSFLVHGQQPLPFKDCNFG